MMGRHVADSPVDTDRLSPWVRSHLEAPSHAAGPHRDPFDNRREHAEHAEYALATGYEMRGGHAWARCLVAPVTELGRDSVVAELAAFKIVDDPSVDPALRALVLERIALNEAVEARLAGWNGEASDRG